jgi:hypothetical protein
MYILKEANSLDDFDAFLALKSQKDAIKWSGFETAPDSVKFKQYYIDKILNNPKTHVFFLCDADMEGCPVVGYRQYDQVSEEVIEVRGTVIKKNYQGTDALEALNSLLAKHYNEKGYKAFSAWISEKNKASEYNSVRSGWTKTDEYEIRNLPLLGGEHKFYKWIKEF